MTCLHCGNEITHGALTTYVYHRCRCELCRAANTAYHRALKARRTPEDAREHGTASSYTNYRCRCDLCTAANTAKSLQTPSAVKRRAGRAK